MKPAHHIKHGIVSESNSQADDRFCDEVPVGSENPQTEEWLRHVQLGTSC